MQADYIVACGVVWRKTLDPVAGSELVEGLQSEDREIRFLAQAILAESGGQFSETMGSISQCLAIPPSGC